MPALGVSFQLTWTSLKVPRSLFTSSRKVAPSCTTLIPSDMDLVKLKGKQTVYRGYVKVCVSFFFSFFFFGFDFATIKLEHQEKVSREEQTIIIFLGNVPKHTERA